MIFKINVVEKTKLRVKKNFSPENHAVYEIIVEQYFRAGQATGDNMAHAHCMLEN